MVAARDPMAEAVRALAKAIDTHAEAVVQLAESIDGVHCGLDDLSIAIRMKS